MSTLITGEAVELELRPARVASRGIAFFLDAVLQVSLLVILLVAANGIVSALGGDQAIIATLSLLATVIALVGYPVVSEVASRGRSLGKAALGLRVVRSDGGPERFRHALVRALFAVVEIWITAGSMALIASLVSKDGKRLGDQFAGTLVVMERTPVRIAPAFAPPPWLVPWVMSADLSRVPDDLAASARQLLVRRHELEPVMQSTMAHELATAMAGYVSPPAPPGTTAQDYLAAVVAERRRREEWRLAQGAAPVMPAPAVPTPAPPSPAPSSPAVAPDSTKPPASAGGFAPPS